LPRSAGATHSLQARLFGNTPEFWLNAPPVADLWGTAQAIKKDVSRMKPLSAA